MNEGKTGHRSGESCADANVANLFPGSIPHIHNIQMDAHVLHAKVNVLLDVISTQKFYSNGDNSKPDLGRFPACGHDEYD